MAPTGDKGWVTTSVEGAVVHVHVTRRDDGRLVADEVRIAAGEVTADLLRQVKPARVVAAVAADAVTLTAKPGDSVVMPAVVRARVGVADVAVSGATTLPRPDGSDPATFYAQVAAAYRSAAVESRKPAVIIAEQNAVPVETVRRWIKEARRRGYLGAGTRGRTG